MTSRGRADAPGYLLTRRATYFAFAGLMLGTFLASFNAISISTAMPMVVREVGGLEAYSWTFTVYMLASTVTVPLWGRASDVYGRRPFLLGGIALITVGCGLGGAADTMQGLIVARTVQGLGAGAVVPICLAAVADLVPASEGGRWSGFLGATFAASSVLGPVTGGWLADHADWRWVFLLPIPIAVVAFVTVAATLRIPAHPARERRVGLTGALLMLAGLSLLLPGLLELGEHRSAEPVPTGLLAAGALLLLVFVRLERRSRAPFVPVPVLRDPLFGRAAAALFAVGAAMFACVMLIPLLAQGVIGTSSTAAGFVAMPLLLAMFVVTIASGEAIDRTGRYRWVLQAGPPLTACGFVLLALIDETSGLALAIGAAVVVGCGLGLLQQNLVLVVQNSVPSAHLGSATSALSFARNVGGTVGMAMGAIVIATAGPQAAELDPGPDARRALAAALQPAFVAFVPLLLACLYAVRGVEELPLRRAVRADHTPAAEIGRAISGS